MRFSSRALIALCAGFSVLAGSHAASVQNARQPARSNAKVLILGGGVSGIIAARTLHEHGVEFEIIEARDELGGRLRSHSFGGVTVEAGANWVQGTQTGSGPSNPIYRLAKKHGLKTRFNDFDGSITTFDAAGEVDFMDIVNRSLDDYTELTVTAGSRLQKKLVDASAQTGYALSGAKTRDYRAQVAQYYQFDFEYAQKPDQSSWVASSWNYNATFVPSQGGFSEENLMSIDQRGFKAIIQEEAKEFLRPDQVYFNSTVEKIAYSAHGVNVTLANGTLMTGDYVICTFSLGVLQNDDVKFEPALQVSYKQEAIQSITMATYTKIFLKFPKKFWFETEMALYADKERGRYPVWQSLDHPKFLPGSGIIFVTVTGDYSERVEALSDAQVQEEVLGVLQAMYPNIEIPKPDAFWLPHWRADPLYRGSYSNWPASFFNAHHENLAANVDRLFFAGEYIDKIYFGFLHGAYFSGLATGELVAKCVEEGGCPSLPHVNAVKDLHAY